MSNLLSRWSKSSENLREKKKWNIITMKTKKKKNLSKSLISTPLDYKHTAGVNPSDGSCFSDDKSSVPAAKTADIILHRKKTAASSFLHGSSADDNIFADLKIKIGSMDILTDVMSVMDKQCPPRKPLPSPLVSSTAPTSLEDYMSGTDSARHDASSHIDNDIDRNSLGEFSNLMGFPGNTTDYTSDTESRGTGYSSTSNDDSERRLTNMKRMDTQSQKDSFYSTTDISQCETDREVQL